MEFDILLFFKFFLLKSPESAIRHFGPLLSFPSPVKDPDPNPPDKVDPSPMSIIRTGLSKPLLFTTTTLLLCTLWQWPRRWLISGAPLLQYFILFSDAKGSRVLPAFQLWPSSQPSTSSTPFAPHHGFSTGSSRLYATQLFSLYAYSNSVL
jgi:hypothetical protein